MNEIFSFAMCNFIQPTFVLLLNKTYYIPIKSNWAWMLENAKKKMIVQK